MNKTIEERIHDVLASQKFYDWYVNENSRWYGYIADRTVSKEDILQDIAVLFPTLIKSNVVIGYDAGDEHC
jgi:hypothetical protein